MTENTKSKFNSYKAEIILIILMLLIILGPKLYFYNIEYKCGLSNNLFGIFKKMFCYIYLSIPFIIVLIVSMVHSIKVIRNAFRTKIIVLSKLLLSIVPVLIPVLSLLFFKAGSGDFLRGYEKWVQKEVDIPAIQSWVMSLDSTYSSRMYCSNEADFSKDLPEFITRFNPPYVRFSDFEKEGKVIEFEWGGAFGHWGLRIGPADMEMPEEGIIEINQSTCESRRPIEPGVYIFSRG